MYNLLFEEYFVPYTSEKNTPSYSSIWLTSLPMLEFGLPFGNLHFMMPLLSDMVGNPYIYPLIVYVALLFWLKMPCHAYKAIFINQTQQNQRSHCKPA